MTSIVTWRAAAGAHCTTRVFTAHVAAFTADVASTGGTVLESHEEA